MVGLPEAVARHLHVPGSPADVERDGRAQLALEQCGLLDDDVVDLLLGGDDGLSRRVDGQAGVHGGGRPANLPLPRAGADAGVAERAEHPAAAPVEQGWTLEGAPAPVVGGVGEPGRRCSHEDDGHGVGVCPSSVICNSDGRTDDWTRPISRAPTARKGKRDRGGGRRTARCWVQAVCVWWPAHALSDTASGGVVCACLAA